MRNIKRQKIVCIGLGKTGTTSFGQAMRTLGYRHCSHGSKLTKSGSALGYWIALKWYQSFDDFPWPYLYRRIDRLFPGTKFVLTRRKNSSTWLESLKKAYCRKGPTEDKFRFYGYFSPFLNESHHMRLYEGHVNAVREYFRGSPNLLEVSWEEGDGWDQLCGFLGISVPEQPFPRENKAPELDYAQEKNDSDRQLAKIHKKRDIG